jgi:Zn-dependent protease
MFGKRIEIFKLLGFPIRIDLSWVVIALLVSYSLAQGFFPVNHPGMPASAYWAMAFVAAVGLFLSILFHELAHSVVGRHYRMKIDGITLFIFGGVAEMREEAATPKIEFLMSIVGPLASGALGLLFFYLQHLVDVNEGNRSLQLIFYYLGFMNLMLAAFNLIPAFPLDGGRVFRSLLWAVKKDYDWATKVAAKIGWGFGWLMMGYGVIAIIRGRTFGGLWYIMIGYFLQQASRASEEQIVLKKALEKTPVGSLMQTSFIELHPDERLSELPNRIGQIATFSCYPVTRAGELVGFLETNRLREVQWGEWQRATVADFSNPGWHELSVDPQTSAWKALEAIKRGKLTLFVTEGAKVLGLITAQELLDFLKAESRGH